MSSACPPPPVIPNTRIADFPTAHIVADRFDFTGEFNSRNFLRITRRRWITAKSLQNVRAIQARRAHSHAHPIGSRLRGISDVTSFQTFDAAEGSYEDCFHWLFQKLARMLHYVVDIESEVFQGHVSRCGGAEAIEANHITRWADVSIPTLSHAGFDRETSSG